MLLKTGHRSCRSVTIRMYSYLFTRAHSAFESSSKLRVKTTLNESTRASGGGGISMEGTSAVGCARKMLFAVKPVSCTPGSSRRPNRTCFQQHLPKDASTFVAVEASLTCARSLPSQLSFAQAFTGIWGVLATMSIRQSQQLHTWQFSSPMPAQRGLSSAG